MTKHFLSRLVRRLRPPRPTRLLAERPELAGYELGRWSYGPVRVMKWNRNGNLTIGSFCSFAADTTIMLGGEHRSDVATTFPLGVFLGGIAPDAHEKSKGDVVIGNDVWIGHGATILSGVVIGDGAIIGAESLVTRDIPAYAIAAGNPARVIRMRFGEATVRQMQQLRWWDWPDDKIRHEAPHLLNEPIAKFLARYDLELEAPRAGRVADAGSVPS